MVFRALVSSSASLRLKMFNNLHTGQIIIFNDLSSQSSSKGSASSKSTKSGAKSGAKSTAPASPSGDVPGLSSQCLSVPATEVGPGASKQGDYKNPEYFCYNDASFFEAEVEMSKFRCPQPSAKSISPQ
ncbi:unnamed protein product [Bemisia tabaci]|uniref:NADH dehydrogenase [ubiquinone] flavoprotein 3, mitochondrial n=1 Tax=Bemisia tabaci TaxID=7038 RepID=A0A9P0AC44_BEMTA|nr:unnamed protein product [Bemisia tabaci]